MTDHDDVERLREVWQSEVVGPPVVSLEDLRRRAGAMRREFDRTTWVPWVLAGGIGGFFGLMLAVSHAPVHRLGGLVGIGAAVYVLGQARRLARRRPLDEGTPGVRAYQWHLTRQRDGLAVSVDALVLMTIASALVSVTEDSTTMAGLLSVVGPLGGGGVTVWYVQRLVRRTNRLIDEIGRLP